VMIITKYILQFAIMHYEYQKYNDRAHIPYEYKNNYSN